jgi:hypothetical protein
MRAKKESGGRRPEEIDRALISLKIFNNLEADFLFCYRVHE